MHEYKLPTDWGAKFDDEDMHKITAEDIMEYWDEIESYYGPSCTACKLFNRKHDMCDKDLRIRRYRLILGPLESDYNRKYCKEFEEAPFELDRAAISTKIRNALDCNYQQYC